MEDQTFSILAFTKSFMQDGGVFMWVILFIWISGLGLSFYKFLTLTTLNINGDKLYDKVKGFVLKNNVENALAICSSSRAVIAKIMRSGLKRANEERALIEDAVSTAIMEHTPQLTYQLSYISLLANISTLVGLLGTIQGLIMSFAGVADADPSMKAKILAMGIANAMNTTAFGLVSAITIMILHTWLTNKAIKMNDKVDEISGKLVDLLGIKRKKEI